MRVEMNERHGYSAESAVFCAVMQWLMLIVTYVALSLLHRIARGAPVEAQATLALGSLVLLAYVAGNIAHRFRIPRIVGYLVAGLVATSGPFGGELVSEAARAALSPISTGALFLIAFAVGNVLTLDSLRGERRTRVLRITTGAMVVPFLAVTLVVLTVSPWFPLTAHQPFRDALLVALALGTVSAVSCPAVIWPVMSDENTHGALPQTTLEVSVLQDFVAAVLVVVLLALALPIGSRGTVTPGSATHTLVAITGSIAGGVALALALTQYLRVIGNQLVWVLAILGLVASQAVRLLGLDAVLMGLVAGLALRAFAGDHRARVRTALERCAIPVYVVFFSLAGANLQLDALNEMWPWLLLLVGLRITGLWAGMQWAAGGRRGHPAVGPEWADSGWLGLVSQGGFAVTLAAVWGRAFPEWNVSLEALVVAMIGVQQLAGPICFQWVLRRTGELTREIHDRAMLGTPPPPASETRAGDGAVLLRGGVQ
jgi:Kef-type K+ transport system membrane component KefB